MGMGMMVLMAYHHPHPHHLMMVKNKCFKTIKQMNFRMALLAFKIWVVLLEGVFLAYGITSIPLSYN